MGRSLLYLRARTCAGEEDDAWEGVVHRHERACGSEKQLQQTERHDWELFNHFLDYMSVYSLGKCYVCGHLKCILRQYMWLCTLPLIYWGPLSMV